MVLGWVSRKKYTLKIVLIVRLQRTPPSPKAKISKTKKSKLCQTDQTINFFAIEVQLCHEIAKIRKSLGIWMQIRIYFCKKSVTLESR